MTQRINSTDESGVSASWTPAAAFTVQGAAADGSNASIELQTRLDAAAPWASVETIRPSAEPLLFSVKLPEVRLSWSGNKGGTPILAWSAE